MLDDSQFHHVIDVAPTVYELAGIPQPKYVDGIEQKPVEGTSMVYAIKDQNAESQHKTQYFNVMANFGVYHEEGVKHNVFPMDGRSAVLFNDEIAGPPCWVTARKSPCTRASHG